jgi:hypothetical protein
MRSSSERSLTHWGTITNIINDPICPTQNDINNLNSMRFREQNVARFHIHIHEPQTVQKLDNKRNSHYCNQFFFHRVNRFEYMRVWISVPRHMARRSLNSCQTCRLSDGQIRPYIQFGSPFWKAQCSKNGLKWLFGCESEVCKKQCLNHRRYSYCQSLSSLFRIHIVCTLQTWTMTSWLSRFSVPEFCYFHQSPNRDREYFAISARRMVRFTNQWFASLFADHSWSSFIAGSTTEATHVPWFETTSERLLDVTKEFSPGFSQFYCMRSRCEIAQQGQKVRIRGTLCFWVISVYQRCSVYADEKVFRFTETRF